MEDANDSAVPERMCRRVRLDFGRWDHDKRMGPWIDSVVIAANIVGRVINASCAVPIDFVAPNANAVTVFMRESVMGVAIKFSFQDATQKVVLKYWNKVLSR
jgi:hypothetical protein